MKKTTTLIACLLVTAWAFAQNIPNRGFEEWYTDSLFETPAGWNTSNFWIYFESGETNVHRTTESHGGNYALEMETIQLFDDTISGVAFSNGNIDGDDLDSLTFTGGFPYSQQPDSLTGWFNYDLEPGDSALVLVAFKTNGIPSRELWPPSSASMRATPM